MFRLPSELKHQQNKLRGASQRDAAPEAWFFCPFGAAFSAVLTQATCREVGTLQETWPFRMGVSPCHQELQPVRRARSAGRSGATKSNPVFLRVQSSSFLVVVLSALNREPPCPVFLAGPALQRPRPSGRSVPCRTSTATCCAQCSLPDLNRDHLRSVFPAGPQLRPAVPSVPFRTSTATIRAQCSLSDLNRDHLCSLPDLNRDHLRSVVPAGPQPRDRMSERMSEDMSCQKECQKVC